MGAIAPGVRDEARYDYAAMSPATVTDATDAALAEAERLIEAVVSAPDPRTFDSTIRPLAAAAAVVWAADGVGSSIGYVHPDAAVRDAANAAEERTPEVAGGSGPARRPGGRDPRLRRHRRGGIARRVAPPIGRPVASRHPARRARPLARAARGVRRPQRPDRRPLRRVRPEPRRLARRHGPGRGRPGGPAADVRRPTRLPARSPGAASSPRATRRRSRSSSSPRGATFARSRSPSTTAGPPRSTPRSSPSSSPRDGAPHRSSAPTHGASSPNEARMSGGRAEVMAFLEGLIGPLQSLAAVEQAAMVEQLPADDPDAVLRASDWIYLHERQRESVGVDFERLAEHFPVDGLLRADDRPAGRRVRARHRPAAGRAPSGTRTFASSASTTRPPAST